MYLHEEILLLALRDEDGKIDWAAGNFRTAMAGALIAELLLAGRIAIGHDGAELVSLLDSSPHDDAVLNEAIAIIAGSEPPRDIQHWITSLSTLKDLKEKTATGLCERGILKAEQGKFLLIFNTISFPESNPEPERQLIERLRRAIFSDDAAVDPRTTLLISLASSSGILAVPFSKEDLADRAQRIASITKGELVGEATGAVIQAMQMALMVAGIMPAIGVAATTGPGSPR